MDLGELVGMTPEIIQKVSHTCSVGTATCPPLVPWALGPE